MRWVDFVEKYGGDVEAAAAGRVVAQAAPTPAHESEAATATAATAAATVAAAAASVPAPAAPRPPLLLQSRHILGGPGYPKGRGQRVVGPPLDDQPAQHALVDAQRVVEVGERLGVGHKVDLPHGRLHSHRVAREV